MIRDSIALSSWRFQHWLVAASIVVGLSIYAGVFPDAGALVSWLASRPEVADAFSEHYFGRADAIILLFSTLFLGPLALLIATVLGYMSYQNIWAEAKRKVRATGPLDPVNKAKRTRASKKAGVKG